MFIPLVKRKLGACSSLRSHAFWEYIGLNNSWKANRRHMALLWVGVQFFSENFRHLQCLPVLILIICNKATVLGTPDFTSEACFTMYLRF